VVHGELARAVVEGDEEQQAPIEVGGEGRFVVVKHVPERDHGDEVHDRQRQGG
jgi:hypothetical protein